MEVLKQSIRLILAENLIMSNAYFRQLRINLVPSSNQLLVSHVSIVCF